MFPQAMSTRLLSRMKEGVVVTDASLKILFVNSAFSSITQYTLDEAVGHTPQLLQREALEIALREGRIQCFFQTQVSQESGQVVAVEALARWVDDSMSLPPP